VEELQLSAIKSNLHIVNDARQTEIDTAGPLVPKPSTFEAVFSLLLRRLKI
jgi:hypothetical protein